MNNKNVLIPHLQMKKMQQLKDLDIPSKPPYSFRNKYKNNEISRKIRIQNKNQIRDRASSFNLNIPMSHRLVSINSSFRNNNIEVQEPDRSHESDQVPEVFANEQN